MEKCMHIEFHNFTVSQNQGRVYTYGMVKVVDCSPCSAGGAHCVGADKPHSLSPLQTVHGVCAAPLSLLFRWDGLESTELPALAVVDVFVPFPSFFLSGLYEFCCCNRLSPSTTT